MTAPAISSRPITTAALVWLALAILVGASGRLATLAPPRPQLVILALTVFAVVAAHRWGAARSWLESVPLRLLASLHAVRFVGIAFLVLSARGALSPMFASRAGWGDVAAAVLALGLVAIGSPGSPGRRALYLGWNVFGLLDLLVAVSTAAWVATRHLEPGMQPLLRLPLSLVPTFVVPLLFASHVVMLRRLAGGARGR